VASRKEEKNIWAGLYRAGWCSLLVFIIVAGIGAFLPKLNKLRQLKAQLDDIDTRVEQRDHTIRDIQERRDKFAKDPAFVERTARQAGFFRPGEVIVEYVEYPGR
jgi:cell division protein FtsB